MMIATVTQSTLSSLRTCIQNDTAPGNSAIQAAINGIAEVNPFADVAARHFAVSSYGRLLNVMPPYNFTYVSVNLNGSIPFLPKPRTNSTLYGSTQPLSEPIRVSHPF